MVKTKSPSPFSVMKMLLVSGVKLTARFFRLSYTQLLLPPRTCRPGGRNRRRTRSPRRNRGSVGTRLRAGRTRAGTWRRTHGRSLTLVRFPSWTSTARVYDTAAKEPSASFSTSTRHAPSRDEPV
ncbi:uncharacterized protein LOC144948289 [Lampetra fluviatilis]